MRVYAHQGDTLDALVWRHLGRTAGLVERALELNPGLCAWLLIVCTGGQALHILLVGAAAHASPWQLGVLAVLAVLTYRARGNVARILRVD